MRGSGQQEEIEGFRLSAQQQGLWPLAGDPVGCAVTVTGSAGEADIRDALAHLVEANEILRTSFIRLPEMALPLQTVHPRGSVGWTSADVSGRGGEEQDSACDELIARMRGERPDLGAGPLLRALFIRCDPGRAVLYLQLPAVVADAQTLVSLVGLLAETIDARSHGCPAPTPDVQYVQFSEWRHELAASGDEETAAGVAYWAGYGVPGTADSPAGELDPGGRIASAHAGARLGAEVTGRLDRLADHLGAEPEAILLAAWACLASRLAGRPAVAIETLFDGRGLDEFHRALGPFTDRLPVRIDASQERTAEAVIGEAATTLAAHREWLELAPSAGLAPVAGEFGFCYLEWPDTLCAGASALAIRRLSDRVFCAGPALSCLRTGQDLVVDVTVPPSSGTGLPAVRDIAGCYVSLLDSLLSQPGRRLDTLALTGPEQRAELLAAFGAGVSHPCGTAAFPELFAAQAASTPDAVALAYGNLQISYGRLARQVSAVARLLRAQGVGRGDVVAFSLPRGPLAVTAMVGILTAGAAFLAIDPADPPARKRMLCADAGAVLLIAGDQDAASELSGSCRTLVLPGRLPAEPDRPDDATVPLTGADAAYVCYTSGTTGVPNGVVVEHASLVNYLRWVNREAVRGAVLPAVSRLTFDASLKQVLGPLLHGGRVWLLAEEELDDPRLLFGSLCSQAAAGARMAFNGVPALWAEVLKAAEQAPARDLAAFRRGMRTVLLGGEALPPRLIARTEALLPQAGLWNLYGPTEATANASGGRVGREHGLSVGFPVDNGQILILGPGFEPVPAGMRGRLFVAGAGVARGYTGRPELTASRFLPHPFPGRPGSRIYDTGDMARFLQDGSVEFLGRDDLQVKVNGFRLELEGTEAVMRTLPGVGDAALAMRETAPGITGLIGYLMPDAPTALPLPALRSALLGRLPRYAVPAQLVQVNELPRTRTGKLDRAALGRLASTEERGNTATAGQRPLSEAEVAGIWARLLGVPAVGTADNFFSLGGHSLLTVELISQVREVTGVQLPQNAVFEAPTLGEFAASVDRELAGADSGSLPELEPVPRYGPLSLSSGQQRSLLLESLEPGARRHNVLAARRIVGTVSEDAVRRALNTIVARHEILRTAFVAEPPGAQVVSGETAVSLTVTDLSSADGDAGTAGVQRRADLLLSQAFDLGRPPLLRAELVRLADGEAVLLLVLHRLVCDGWSKTLCFDEFAAAYRAALAGGPLSLPALTVQYADFAAWERRRATPHLLAEQAAYWRERLTGMTPLRMPVDHPRGKAPSHRGSSVRRRLSPELTATLRSLSREAGSTLFMTTLTAFAMLLAHYSGQSDIVVVTPVTARRRTELAALIGPFLNLLPLRIDLRSDPSFAELLRRVRATALAANARQDLPFERLAGELLSERGGAPSAAFPVMFNYTHAAAEEIEVRPGTVLRAVDIEPGSSASDLELLLEEGPDSILVHLIADLDLYEITTAERILASFEAMLRSAGEGPDRPMSEHFLAVARGRAAARPVPAERGQAYRGGVARIFAARARACAPLPAVTRAGVSVSYGELDVRSNQLARHLMAQGVTPGQIVALLMDSTVDLIVAMVAVIKAGAGFLALNGEDTAALLRRQLAESRPAVLLASRGLAERAGPAEDGIVCLDAADAAIGDFSADPPAVSGRDPRHPACAIPGERAAVILSHESLERATLARSAYYAEPVASMLVLGSPGSQRFAAAVFWTLCGGGCLTLPSAGEGEPDPAPRIVRDHQVTHLMTTPSRYLDLCAGTDPANLASLRAVIVSGEPLYGPQVSRHFRLLPEAGLFHEYGAGQCGGWGLVRECSREDAGLDLVPVSGPAMSGGWHVLSDAWHQVPDGVEGELFAGAAHSAAYAGPHQALTAATLVPDPFSGQPGARMYRTGDLARLEQDGSVTVLGRAVEQIRLPGLTAHRIAQELAVAELLRDPAVRGAAVAARADSSGSRASLTAYVVPADGEQADTARLLHRLRSVLPGHVVPDQVVRLDELPRTRDGAIDRAVLAGLRPAGPAPVHAASGQAAVRPGLVSSLASIWAEEFSLPAVREDDDFFALGGNSLLALHLLARIEDEFDVTLPLQALFEASTVAELAGLLEESLDHGEAAGTAGYGQDAR